jgi:hypothetical protein
MEGVSFSISAVIAGLDPAIHHFEDSLQEDGCPDQVRA